MFEPSGDKKVAFTTMSKRPLILKWEDVDVGSDWLRQGRRGSAITLGAVYEASLNSFTSTRFLIIGKMYVSHSLISLVSTVPVWTVNALKSSHDMLIPPLRSQ